VIPFPHRGLYAITQCENKLPEQILAEVAGAIRGGARVIQYRDKNNPDRLNLALRLRDACHNQGVPLIINDDVALAGQVQADGVHLGRDDGDIAHARALLGADAIIGVSCYNDLTRAQAAQEHGATYVAFGRFFPSSSKPLASPAELSILMHARKVLQIPIVAIGGILPENGGQLIQAGADVLAVIGGIFDSDPEPAAAAFMPLFDHTASA
jgi:thiamine-phosphate pyrophosphorylase